MRSQWVESAPDCKELLLVSIVSLMLAFKAANRHKQRIARPHLAASWG